MKTLMISGGSLDEKFALNFIAEMRPDYILGIDRGLNFCYQHEILPSYIMGDFDSIDSRVMEYYMNNPGIPVERFQPEKDATDTQIGIEKAIELKSTGIWILGATGGRMDHFWGNVQCLALAHQAGIPAVIVDPQNYITLLGKETMLEKSRQFGTHVSFFPLGDAVEGLTLEGFKYPLTDHYLKNSDGLGVSNEIAEDTAIVKYRQGMLLMMMSKDREA